MQAYIWRIFIMMEGTKEHKIDIVCVCVDYISMYPYIHSGCIDLKQFKIVWLFLKQVIYSRRWSVRHTHHSLQSCLLLMWDFEVIVMLHVWHSTDSFDHINTSLYLVHIYLIWDHPTYSTPWKTKMYKLVYCWKFKVYWLYFMVYISDLESQYILYVGVVLIHLAHCP